MRLIILLFSLVLSSQITVAQSYAGSWYGKADLGAAKLRITFHVEVDADNLNATMDSPDQEMYGLPADTAYLNNEKLVLEFNKIGLTFTGELNDDNEILDGTISQMGREFAVELTHEKIEKEKVNRPQEPKPPFDYEVREVTFKNNQANVLLAGTLTIPKGKGPFPAVVLVSGSGPQNRNEEIMQHKPFLVIADYFAKKGIAVLRYDDRGVGESKGNFAKATSEDFASDAVAAIEFLQKEKKIKKNATGLAGHSEGGMVSALAATQSDDVDFIISLAGTGVSGAEVLITQMEDISLAEGTPESAVEATLAEQRMIINAIEEAENYEQSKKELSAVLDTLLARSAEKVPNPESLKEQTMSQYATPWMYFFIKYDPSVSWSKIGDIPVLAVNGTKDLQVNAEQNLKSIERALNEAGNEDVTTMKIHGLNHLFQQSATGRVSEYSEIEETFNESVLELMSTWINERF